MLFSSSTISQPIGLLQAILFLSTRNLSHTAQAFVVPHRMPATSSSASRIHLKTRNDVPVSLTPKDDNNPADLSEEPSKEELPLTPRQERYYIENPVYDIVQGTKPAAAGILAAQNFARQGSTIMEQLFGVVTDNYLTPEGTESKIQAKKKCRPPDCFGFRLSNEAVKQAEREREAKPGGKVDANPVSRGLYDLGCLILDTLFDERPIQRFWFLEIIARIPYFSYVSMLHLYESLGWWRGSELRKVHTAEEWNELHHLLIMESLGGNSLWSDRFLGYHVAILYYWMLNVVFLFSPRVAYQFMELLEAHAVDTYGTFVKENRQRLQQLPAPEVAVSYYADADLYMFDDFQVSRSPGSRRPPCDTLCDVFENICADEAEHVKTMQACQDYAVSGKLVVSPHTAAYEPGDAVNLSTEEAKRLQWKEWSEQFSPLLDLDARSNDSGAFD